VELGLRGKQVLVTGGSKGIGLACDASSGPIIRPRRGTTSRRAIERNAGLPRCQTRNRRRLIKPSTFFFFVHRQRSAMLMS
jgi:hypothetical protein